MYVRWPSVIAPAPDAVVVGNGVVGGAVALRLARAGCQVTLVGPRAGALDAASWAAGAMLGALGEVTSRAGPDGDLLDLRLQAADGYPRWLDEIAALAGRRPRTGSGTFLIATGRRGIDRANLDTIVDVAREHGRPVEQVSPSNVPGLSPSAGNELSGALFLPDEGFVDAPDVLDLLGHALVATGRVRLVDDTASALLDGSGRIDGIRTAGHGDLEAPWTVVCAGVGTTALLDTCPDLAAGFPRVVAGKGVSLVLRNDSPRGSAIAGLEHAIRTPNREFACGLHVLPRGMGSVYLGATNRVGSRVDVLGGLTAGEVDFLLRGAIHELSTEFARWDVTGWRYGFRPIPVDGRPLAGRTDVEGLAIVTGTYRNGMLLAPLLADVVADELIGQGPMPGPLSPIGRGAPSPDQAVSVIRAAIPELMAFLADPGDGALWAEDLRGFLDALVRMSFDEPDHELLREKARTLITAYPISEMLPELMIVLAELT